MNTFGVKEEDVEYRVRKGVYALIEGDKGHLAIVGRAHKELYELPGGGIEEGESHEEGLKRELIEELGWSIQIESYLGKSIQYTTLSPHGNYYRLEGHFYTAAKLAHVGGKIEEDHIGVWLSVEDAIQKVKYEYQRWAIKTFQAHQNVGR